jgi:hypothetical protein
VSRKLVMAVVLTLTTALTTLAVPGTASASDRTKGDPGQTTVRVEKSAPTPSKMTLRAVAEMEKNRVTPLARGGGCANTYGARSCISWTRNQHRGDFYVNSRDRVVSNGIAVLYIRVNGTWYYKYAVPTAFLGHYPMGVHNTAAGSSGSAVTVVEFYNSGGSYLFAALSPFQYWP